MACRYIKIKLLGMIYHAHSYSVIARNEVTWQSLPPNLLF